MVKKVFAIFALILLQVTSAYVKPKCPILKPCEAINLDNNTQNHEPDVVSTVVKRSTLLTDLDRTALKDPKFRSTRINCLSKILEEEANNTDAVRADVALKADFILTLLRHFMALKILSESEFVPRIMTKWWRASGCKRLLYWEIFVHGLITLMDSWAAVKGRLMMDGLTW